MKVTKYFQAIRSRPDRAVIQDEWIPRVIEFLEREYVQADGRVRRWAKIEEMEDRYLQVVLLADRETVGKNRGQTDFLIDQPHPQVVS